MHRSLALWPLLFVLLFLAIGGLYGGVSMLADPAGGSLQLTEIVPLLPVESLILPGLFLLFVMGMAPLVLIYGLLACPDWNWANALLGWSRHHWAWTGTLGLAAILAIWLAFQGVLIGFKWPIQYITAINGCLIFLFALVPGVRRFYSRK